ncbi:hypothetical protein SAMN05443247_03864 [Bradyrhizobium erythrophlei]|nr:hypothetical protein SAMN05443247_03864 [Bradyrhizobium erythrophlei]
MADHSLSSDSVTVTGLFHDLMLKRSSASVVWANDTEKRLGLPVGVHFMTFKPRPKKPCANCPT